MYTSLNFRGDVTEEKQSKQIMYDTMKQLFEQNFGSYIDLKGFWVRQWKGKITVDSKQFNFSSLTPHQKRVGILLKKNKNSAKGFLIFSVKANWSADGWIECTFSIVK